MIEIKINTKKPYSVIIGENLLNLLGKEVLSVHKPSKIMVISDDNVSKFYLESVLSSLKNSGFDTYFHIIESGEENKNINTYLKIINALSINLFSRKDLLLSLGGGVVSDITGFAASTYMRGIDYVNVPTTLLSMIDASIGGKTAIDTKFGKNLIGTFWQPLSVYIDTQTLNTLPEKEIKNGLGEAIKYAVLKGGEIYKILADKDYNTDINRFITLCAECKKEYVEADEKESGKRIFLNLGHTVGHAVETLSGYKISHGEAVVKGLFKMVSKAYHKGLLDKEDFNKILALINKFDFDLSINFSWQELLSAILHDKKTSFEDISIIEVESIGKCKISRLSVKEMEKFLQ